MVSDQIIQALNITSEGAIGKSNKFGNESHFQIGLENEKGTGILFNSLSKRKEAINYLEKALRNGDPVVTGVHYSYRKNKKQEKRSHNEGTTDHYLVIIGRFEANGVTYYSY